MLPVHAPVFGALTGSPFWWPICLFAGLLIYWDMTQRQRRDTRRRVVVWAFIAFIAASSLHAAIYQPYDMCQGLEGWALWACRAIWG